MVELEGCLDFDAVVMEMGECINELELLGVEGIELIEDQS